MFLTFKKSKMGKIQRHGNSTSKDCILGLFKLQKSSAGMLRFSLIAYPDSGHVLLRKIFQESPYDNSFNNP